MIDAKTEQIMEKVRKLLALATSSNPFEAALAAQRAQEILQKYNLDLLQISEKEVTSDYIKIEEDLGSKQNVTWRRILIWYVGETNFCRVVILTGTNRSAIIGKKHNIEVVQYLYTYLVREIVRLSHVGWKVKAGGSSNMQADDGTWRNPWVASFCLGALSMIGQRLKEARDAFKQETTQTMALIVLTDRQLDEAKKQLIGKTKAIKTRSVSKIDGFQDGREAGKSIALNPALKSGQRGRISG